MMAENTLPVTTRALALSLITRSSPTATSALYLAAFSGSTFLDGLLVGFCAALNGSGECDSRAAVVTMLCPIPYTASLNGFSNVSHKVKRSKEAARVAGSMTPVAIGARQMALGPVQAMTTTQLAWD